MTIDDPNYEFNTSFSNLYNIKYPNSYGILTGITACTDNINASQRIIQNQATTPLFVLLGSGSTQVSNTNFSVVLKGGTGALDGSGEKFYTNFKGIILVTGGTISYTVTEFTTST